MNVFLLRAAHQSTPGIVTKIFATRELANAEAADLVNLMLASERPDYGMTAEAFADDWAMVLGDLVEWLDCDEGEEPFVEIDEMPVIAPEPIAPKTRFTVCLQQYVENVASFGVDADSPEEAAKIGRDLGALNAGALDWREGDDAEKVRVYAVLDTVTGEQVWGD